MTDLCTSHYTKLIRYNALYTGKSSNIYYLYIRMCHILAVRVMDKAMYIVGS